MWEVEGRDEVSVHGAALFALALSFSTRLHLGHHPHLEVSKHVTNLRSVDLDSVAYRRAHSL